MIYRGLLDNLLFIQFQCVLYRPECRFFNSAANAEGEKPLSDNLQAETVLSEVFDDKK